MDRRPLTGPEKLSKSHRLDAFSCGIESLDGWLTRFAWINQQSDLTSTYVVHRAGSVVGRRARFCVNALAFFWGQLRFIGNGPEAHPAGAARRDFDVSRNGAQRARARRLRRGASEPLRASTVLA